MKQVIKCSKRKSYCLLLAFVLSIQNLSLPDYSWAHLKNEDLKMEFWNRQRKGANLFNKIEKIERLKAAKKFGIELIRLAPNKWTSDRAHFVEGDFLLKGSSGEVDLKDLGHLKKILDAAEENRLKVAITMLSLPGSRWKQHNHGIEDRRIWQDFKQQEKVFQFWKSLAAALRDHPAIVGYNIRNEPSPEFVKPQLQDWLTGDYISWYKKVKGTPADLNLFYKKVVKSIRTVDTRTPIILDSGFYASPWAFKVLEPIDDSRIIYAFHMYEPYSYNSRFNQGKYQYPGKIPTGELSVKTELYWDKRQIEQYLRPVDEWQKKYKIPSTRIFVGEFGVYRKNQGAENYLKDLIDIFNQRGWHWAFYSFREDTWDGMDYELGTNKPGWKYWQAIEEEKMPDDRVYKSNPLSRLLQKGMGLKIEKN